MIEGLLLRRAGIEGRHAAELLGPGDLLRPWQHDDAATRRSRSSGRGASSRHARVAVLDPRWTARAAAWPQLGAELAGRALARSLRLVIAMAIAQQPRLDERLWMLFWDLADRFGKVHADGVHLDLPLTHEVLSHLAGARRPSVSGALTRLADEGRLRRSGRHWVLSGDRRRSITALRTPNARLSCGPDRLSLLQPISVSSSAAIRSGTGCGGLAVLLGRLDLAALALLAHDRLQPLAVLVLVVRAGPSRRSSPRSSSPRASTSAFFVRPPAPGMPSVGRTSSWKRIVVERQRLLAGADRDEVLLAAQDEAPERGPVGPAHHLRQQAVGAHGAVGLAGGDEEVRVVEVDRVDLVELRRTTRSRSSCVFFGSAAASSSSVRITSRRRSS